MVAYSFKKQFVEPIERGLKRQTIRAHRKRHARPGEFLQIYFGMRTKHCRKIIDDPECKSITPIGILVGSDWFEEIYINDKCLVLGDEGVFAKEDGFESVDQMHDFWLKEHGEGWFEGVIIKW